MRPPVMQAVLAALLAVLMVACGSSASSSGGTPPGASATGSSPTKPEILPVVASSEFGVGQNRVVVSLLDATGSKPVAGPDRKLAVGFRGPSGEAIPARPATFIWATEPISGVYILTATFPSAGTWTADFTTSAPGSAEVSLPFGFDVKERTSVLRAGDPAPSVATPTLADVGGDVSKISTDTTPVQRFYETSEADALAARKPFVLAFATPKFCKTATCGPTLDKLKPIAAAHPEMTFINVEPYQLKDVDGQLQPVLDGTELKTVPATDAFRLLSEPYVFVVGADGKIASSFELIFTPEEIEAAIKAVEG